MHHLVTIDYAIILAFFVCLAGIGLYFKRMASESLEHYFLGGRRIPWWAMGITGMTYWFDMAGVMLITSFLFLLGPRGLLIEFRGGAGLVIIAMLLFTGKWHRRSQCMTGAEWMEFRFGSGFGGQLARIASALTTLIGAVAGVAYIITGAGKFLSPFFNWSPEVCAIIMIAFATLYTIVSGFYGVVFSDIFQGAIMVVACIIIGAWGTWTTFHQGNLPEVAAQVSGNAAWMTVLPQWHTPMPPGDYQKYTALLPMLGFIMLQKIMEGLGSGADTRFFGARSDRECGTLAFTWQTLMVFCWPLMTGFAVLGLYVAHDLYPDPAVWGQAATLIKDHLGMIDRADWDRHLTNIIAHPAEYGQLAAGLQRLLGQDWTTVLRWVSYDGTFNPESVLPAVIITRMGPGLQGFIVMALLAAGVSTFNATVNGAAAYWTRDLYQRYLRPKAGNRELLASTYGCILVMVLLGFYLAYSTKSINDMWSWITMGLGAAVGMCLLKFYWWRFNGGGLATGMIVGLISAVAYRLCQTAYWDGNPRWQWLMDEKWQFCILLGISLCATLLGTYLTRPTEPAVLQNFYRKTRPLGFWGPCQKLLPPEERAAIAREHRNDLIALPFTFIYHVCLLLVPILLVTGNLRSLVPAVALGLLGLGGMYLFWYRNLPADDFPKEQGLAQIVTKPAQEVTVGPQ